MAKIIENFNDKRQNYGKKGNNLKLLMEIFKNDQNIIIPETLILPNSLFKSIVEENGDADFSDYNNICINPRLKKEILQTIHKKFGNDKLVIRSSATCEDSIFFSGSGQYSSFINITEDEKIIEAIKKVYASLFNKNSQLYSKIYNINLKKESMAVLIQKVAPVIKSGVMFSCNPVDQSKQYIIESTSGLGTCVVEGTGNINHLEIDYTQKNELKDKELKSLVKVIDEIKRNLNLEVDIEWGIDANSKIYIFQARPIIYREMQFKIEYDESIVSQKCVPISKGFSIGKIENITNKNMGEILYQNEKYDFNDLELLLTSKGVILKDNAKLSHFANILRELTKPCVYIEKFKFKTNNLYIIDSFKGNIIDFEKLNSSDKIKMLFNNFEYLAKNLDNSFERYNGITDITNDDKYEEVVFDIDEKKIYKILKNNGYKKKRIEQKIYTYDFSNKFLINNNVIFRIQISNNNINVQFKQLDTENEKYRKEKGIIIKFDNLKNAKKFMQSYLMTETGYQERKILKYENGRTIINVIKWPGSPMYLGIESKTLEGLKIVNQELGLDNCIITGWGGKKIFEKLNLTLTNCKFDERVK